MSEETSGPLAGVRVLDCATEIAGPYAAKLLVEGGADVLKIEPPGGDPLRSWTASHQQLPEGESGALFQFLNASKRSLVLDVDTPEGREELLDLAAHADLVIESLPPARARELALDAATFQQRNPATSLVSITPWGRSGPYADRPATEFTLQAAVGSTAYRGLPERGPVAAGGRIGEWVAGTYAGLGALGACLAARQTGRGRHIDVSMFECLVLAMTVYHDLQSQWVDTPLGQAIEIPSIEPAQDGWVGFCTITGQQWMDFCNLIGQPEVAKDERYLDATMRMAHLDHMQRIMHNWTREHSVEEIVEIASAMRIPVAPVGDGQTLPKIDQLKARGVYRRATGDFLQPRAPFIMSETPERPLGESPALDAHAEEIRAELRGQPASAGRQAERSPQPLSGIRVLDLTTFWAGPVATNYLASLGADVVKVESIQRPDGMRFAGAARRESLWEWSPVFAGANLGKRGITLRLDDPAGLDLVKRLAADSDVVIENFSPRVVENFGLGWEVVHALNPAAIMVRMPAFGLDGPWRDRTGFAMTIEQVSGLAWMTGYPDLPLVVRGTCDPVGGTHAVFATLLALEERKRNGKGQLVEVPLLEAALNIGAEQVLEHSAYGVLLSRDGNRGPYAAPQGVYPCAGDSGPVAVAVTDDAQWQGLREALGDPEWARDPALSHASGRRQRHDDIDAGLSAWTETLQASDAEARLCQAGVPAQVLINAHSLSPHPQLEARAFFDHLEHPVTGETRYPGWPLGAEAFADGPDRRPPPMLGEHNEEILRERLGLSEEEIEKLQKDAIIGTRPSFM